MTCSLLAMEMHFLHFCKKEKEIRQNKLTYQECVTYQHLLYKCLIFMCTWLCISENCATDSAAVLSSSI